MKDNNKTIISVRVIHRVIKFWFWNDFFFLLLLILII